jgi:hypothetical protein
MERVIVTVKKYQETRVRDLDIPTGLEAGKLSEIIASALHWDQDSSGSAVRYRIEAEPPGRVLENSETLVAAGVCDGAWLTFITDDDLKARRGQDAQSQQSPKKPAPQPSPSPVSRWKPLGIDHSGGDESGKTQTPTEPKSKGGFVWKEFDVDN